jgi:hypothetical protein
MVNFKIIKILVNLPDPLWDCPEEGRKIMIGFSDNGLLDYGFIDNKLSMY